MRTWNMYILQNGYDQAPNTAASSACWSDRMQSNTQEPQSATDKSRRTAGSGCIPNSQGLTPTIHSDSTRGLLQGHRKERMT